MKKTWEEHQLAQHELKSSQDSLDRAGKQNEELSEESRQKLNSYYDKILLYSAGAFSFSATLVGLVVDDKIEALSTVGLLIPNIHWMHMSLTFFLLSGIAIIFSKKLDAFYVAHFGLRNYTEKYFKKEKTFLRLLKKHSESFLVTDEGTVEGEIKTAKSNIPKLKKSYSTNVRKQKLYYNLMVFFRQIGETSSLFGSITLFLFVIQLSQSIVWG